MFIPSFINFFNLAINFFLFVYWRCLLKILTSMGPMAFSGYSSSSKTESLENFSIFHKNCFKFDWISRKILEYSWKMIFLACNPKKNTKTRQTYIGSVRLPWHISIGVWPEYDFLVSCIKTMHSCGHLPSASNNSLTPSYGNKMHY